MTPEEVSRTIRLLAVSEILLRDLDELDDPAIEPVRADIRGLCERLRAELEGLRGSPSTDSQAYGGGGPAGGGPSSST